MIRIHGVPPHLFALPDYDGRHAKGRGRPTQIVTQISAPELRGNGVLSSGLTQPCIAWFWTDINITSGTATGNNTVCHDLDPGSGRVTVIWRNVAACSRGGARRNTFQVV